ncbi:hypothetical protein TNCV_4193041 [Trichonephila clavipes]|nr:hypothetical protein TNCV_4193041 [Trichonephila clavipes]
MGVSNNCFVDVIPHSSCIHVASFILIEQASWSTASFSEHELQRCRINIKLLVKLKKSATKTFQILTKAYGDENLSGAHVFEWVNSSEREALQPLLKGDQAKMENVLKVLLKPRSRTVTRNGSTECRSV